MSGWQFPQWNYGYTQMPGYYLGPPHAGFTPGIPTRPAFPMVPQVASLPQPGIQSTRPPFRPPLPSSAPKVVATMTPAPATATAPTAAPTTATATATSPPVIKAEATAVKKEEKPPVTKPEEASSTEKSVLGILKGRNPVMFCNDQSKLRGLHMEWEQVSEAGPPHDKTYEYQLKMGPELAASGVAKNKKDAKTKAAENMVLKLDELPRVNKRPYQQGGGWGGSPGWGFQGGMGRGGYGHHGHGREPAWKKRKGETEDAILRKNDVTPKTENPSQNNPISKLYELSKKRRWPEPIFDCISEEVLEERRTEKGFTLRKTNFSLRCTVRMPAGQGEDKIYLGNALTKKQAKTNAAQAAWAELGGGVSQQSVDSLLAEARGGEQPQIAGPAAPSPALTVVKPDPAPVIPAQPKITMHKPSPAKPNLFNLPVHSVYRKF